MLIAKRLCHYDTASFSSYSLICFKTKTFIDSPACTDVISERAEGLYLHRTSLRVNKSEVFWGSLWCVT